jgi:catabolite regulation protein CreA
MKLPYFPILLLWTSASKVVSFGVLSNKGHSTSATENARFPLDTLRGVVGEKNHHGQQESFSFFCQSPLQALGATILSMVLLWNSEAPFIFSPTPPPVHALESKVVGELKGSGLVFKDTLQIERFEDPKVKGVVLYVSNFQRPITEKLSGKNFFNDPSSAGVGCARIGPVSIADNIVKGTGGEEVFQESRSLLFKTLRVQRIYDEEEKTIVYVSFSTRLDKTDDTNSARFKSSLCAVNLD